MRIKKCFVDYSEDISVKENGAQMPGEAIGRTKFLCDRRKDPHRATQDGLAKL